MTFNVEDEDTCHRSFSVLAESGAGKAEILSFKDPQHLRRAAQMAKNGCAIATFLGGTTGIVGDGGSNIFVENVSKAKGEKRGEKALAGLLTASQVIEIADIDEIPPNFKEAFFDPEELAARLGNMGFLRFTIKREFEMDIPASMVTKGDDGRHVFQAFIPTGNVTLELLCRAMDEESIEWKAGTSLNTSSAPEIVRQDEAIAFVTDSEVLSIYVRGREANPRRHWGRYPIFQAFRDRFTLERRGFISDEHLSAVLGCDLQVVNPERPVYEQTVFPSEFQRLKMGERRAAIMLYLEGYETEEIMKNFR